MDDIDRLKKESALLRSIMANIPDAIILTDNSPLVAHVDPTTGRLSVPSEPWITHVKDSLLAVLLRARSSWRDMGNGFAETKSQPD